MPANEPLPSIRDFLGAYRDSLRGESDPNADARTGAIYDHPNGAAAALFSRGAQRDRDLFRAVYFDTAQGSDLTNLVAQRFGVDRILDTKGTGSAVLRRTSNAGGAGTFWRGTRFSLVGALSTPLSFDVTADTAVGATGLIATVPIEAMQTGPGFGTQLVTSGLRIDDPLWDNTWTIDSLVCGDGTAFEEAAAFRARVRSQRVAARKGREQSIIDACVAVGASTVVLFASYWGLAIDDYADDPGINACYVADSGFTGTTALVNNCQVALESARVLGASLHVLPMAQSTLVPDLTVTLRDNPGRFDTGTLGRAIQGNVAAYFKGASSGFTYKRDAIAAAARVSPDVQDVAVNVPVSDVTLTPGVWPATLTRYTVNSASVKVAFIAPS
jgi:hypothetical protein